MTDVVEIYDTELLLVENDDGSVLEYVGSAIIVIPATGDVSTAGKTGSYTDLTNKPVIPDAQVPSDWNATTGVSRILNKPDTSDSRVLGTLLAGLTTATSIAITATDSIISGLGKLQAQINTNTSQISSNTTAISGKEPTISSGTTSQYWRGDKTWRDLPTDIRGVILTGLSTATATAITATDTIISAFGKLQAQVSNNTTAITNNATSIATKANSSINIIAGTGLTGGGDLSADRTLSLTDTGVVAGTYGSATAVPVLTLDAKGRVSAATTAAISASGGGISELMGVGTGLQAGSFLSGMYFDTAGLAAAAASQSSNYTTSKCFPIIFSKSVRISQMGFNITSGAATGLVINVSVYSAHPTHGFPYQRLTGVVNVDATSTGLKMTTLDYTFDKNTVYWIRVSSNNGSLSLTAHVPNYCFGNGESGGFLGPNKAPATMIWGPSNSGQNYPNSPYFIYSSGDGTTEQQPSMLQFKNETAIPKILFKAY